MNVQDCALIRELPRDQLERVALRALEEAGLARREAAAGETFTTAVMAFSAGALTAAAGFILGLLLT